ncbi:MAG: GDP-mannose 4,6-dehydratase [Planctomycetota bacterium]
MTTTLITGGAGFIGSHLAERLLGDGDQVIIVDDLSTGSTTNLSAIVDNSKLEVINGSVADDQLVNELIDRSDRVFHLAAAVGVALIAGAPVQTIERNIYPTQLILDALVRHCRGGNPKPVFLASTSEVYGKNPKSTWCEEDDLVFGATTRPRWSYGVSKAVDEFLGLAAAKESGLPVIVGRFFNTVGPRQTGKYGMVLPRFVSAALANEALVVHDDGQQIRCFAHVADVIGAVVKLTETPQAAGRVYNIGSDQPTSIVGLAQRVIDIVGSESQVQFQPYAEAYDASFEDIRRRVPDLTRVRETIGYRPTHTLEDIIRDVVAYQRSSGA